MGYNFNLRSVLAESAMDTIGLENISRKTNPLLSVERIPVMLESEEVESHIAQSIENNNSDPMQLRISMDESTNRFYIDYNEFVSYCEATKLDPYAAVFSITESYDDYDDMNMESFYIVFPKKDIVLSAIKESDIFGYQDLLSTSKFMEICIESGINVVSFTNDDYINEGYYGDTDNTHTTKGHEKRTIRWEKFKQLFKSEKESTSVIIQKRLDKVITAKDKIEKELKSVLAETKQDRNKRYKDTILMGALYSAAAGLKPVIWDAALKNLSLKTFKTALRWGGSGAVLGASVNLYNNITYIEQLRGAKKNLEDVEKYLKDCLEKAKTKEQSKTKNESAIDDNYDIVEEGFLKKKKKEITDADIKQCISIMNMGIDKYSPMKKMVIGGKFKKTSEIENGYTVVGKAMIDPNYAEFGSFLVETQRELKIQKCNAKFKGIIPSEEDKAKGITNTFICVPR